VDPDFMHSLLITKYNRSQKDNDSPRQNRLEQFNGSTQSNIRKALPGMSKKIARIPQQFDVILLH